MGDMAPVPFTRRSALLAAALSLAMRPGSAKAGSLRHPDARWFDAAESMRRRAVGWGDQNYGAVLVLGAAIVGEGPSRVVKDGNPDAHAERVAIADAQRRLARQDLAGAVLYSTSTPCAACEQAAARAGVVRMYVGQALHDAGRPQDHGR